MPKLSFRCEQATVRLQGGTRHNAPSSTIRERPRTASRDMRASSTVAQSVLAGCT